MEKVKEKIDVDALLTKCNELIEQGKDFLLKDGKVMEFSEWLTIAEYSKKYNKTTSLISQWINRGIIPDTCYIDIPEIGKKLIKDKVYKD